MTNLISDTVLQYWRSGRKTRTTPSGWISGNAVCCVHRGQSPDKRGRGGILISGDGFQWHCFNCNFKAGWTPGHTLSQNTRKLLSWLGVSTEDINKLVLEAMKAKNDLKPTKNSLNLALELKELPHNCKSFDEWVHEGCEDIDFLNVVAYVLDRGFSLDWYPWMWSPDNGYRDRVIIPYYYEGKIVGWTARKVTDGKPKYLSVSQPSYVFNLDRQLDEREYIIVVEGPMDAIPIDGIAVLSNELNESQILRINSFGKKVILVPDNDPSGAKLINVAIEQNWHVSLPEWGSDVKDVAEAVAKYGRIYTLYTILKYADHGPIKLTMIKKRIEQNAEE